MTNQKIRAIIEKLSQLTVARGATEAEALVAQEKIIRLRAQLTPEPSRFTYSRYEPKTTRYDYWEYGRGHMTEEDYKEYPNIMGKPLTPAQIKEWYELLDQLYRKNHQAPPKRKYP